MIFCKIAGGAILLLSALLLANYKNKSAALEITRVDGFLAFFKFMRDKIDCYVLTVPEIFSRCDRETLYACGLENDLKPKTISEFFSLSDVRGEGLLRILDAFEADFGKSYKDTEIRLLDRYISMLEDEKKRLEAALPSRKRLNLTLLIALATAIIILLI